MRTFKPAYLRPGASAKLAASALTARERLRRCTLCPRSCGVNRLAGETGFCRTAEEAWISSFAPHFGEERPLVGHGGSGTIFITHCNLGCVFCQNYDISHQGAGQPVSSAQLAACMLQLQAAGCHNINFVSPSHVVPQILAALELAIPEGMQLPLVYNSGGYDDVDTLQLLDGIFDIYMPDFKFWQAALAERYCGVADYPEVASQALTAMHRQVGTLVMDSAGVARRGLIARHLVMPNALEDTRAILDFIATNLSVDTYVNLMPQYRPCGDAHRFDELRSRLTRRDYENALLAAMSAGLRRLD
jgi:putative pyruvate formate lyase activating enzyme